MICRSLLPSAALLAVASACSSGSSRSPLDSEGLDAEAEAADPSNDETDAGEPPSDASATHESGSAPGAPEAGTAAGHDAGTTRVACNQPALGVCQTAVVSVDAEVRWRAQCTGQGGSAEACPTSGLVGCCVGDTSHYCYYAADYTSSTAQDNCSVMNGTWSTSM